MGQLKESCDILSKNLCEAWTVYSLQEQLKWAWLVKVGYNLLFTRQASYSLMNLILSFKSILDIPVETRNNEIISSRFKIENNQCTQATDKMWTHFSKIKLNYR